MKIDDALRKYTEKYQFLHVPGLDNSGADHWHTNWEKQFPQIKRVVQQDWESPDKEDWVNTLESYIQKYKEKPIVLISHSLGSAAVIHADKLKNLQAVKAAFLVALPDVERGDFPEDCTGFSPLPKIQLSFPAVMVSSANDAWCNLAVAEKWAKTFNIPLINIGKKQHICGEKQFETWEEGKKILVKFLDSLEP